jgi:hypothetical protein
MHPQLIRNRRAFLPQKPRLSQPFQKLTVSGWTLTELVRVHKGVFFSGVARAERDERDGRRATFRALVATTEAGIGKRAVEHGMICRFFIALQSGAAKPV